MINDSLYVFAIKVSTPYNDCELYGHDKKRCFYIEKTKMSGQKMDMLHGPIWNKIIQYALPVAATGILEQLFNASDIAVVGNFTGDAKTVAVAAVGANSPIVGLILNLFIGIALGANVSNHNVMLQCLMGQMCSYCRE